MTEAKGLAGLIDGVVGIPVGIDCEEANIRAACVMEARSAPNLFFGDLPPPHREGLR